MTVGSLLLLHVFGDGTQIVKPAIRGPLPSEHLMSPRICLFSDRVSLYSPGWS